MKQEMLEILGGHDPFGYAYARGQPGTRGHHVGDPYFIRCT